MKTAASNSFHDFTIEFELEIESQWYYEGLFL